MQIALEKKKQLEISLAVRCVTSAVTFRWRVTPTTMSLRQAAPPKGVFRQRNELLPSLGLGSWIRVSVFGFFG